MLGTSLRLHNKHIIRLIGADLLAGLNTKKALLVASSDVPANAAVTSVGLMSPQCCTSPASPTDSMYHQAALGKIWGMLHISAEALSSRPQSHAAKRSAAELACTDPQPPHGTALQCG